MFSGLGAVTDGTRSTISRPKPSRPPYLAGLLVMQPHGGDAEVDEDLRADAVLAAVDRQAELDVGVDGVVALVLQVVGADLVADADAAALVAAQVDDDAEALVGDQLHGRVELHAAVAAQRAEHVAGEALAVHPHEHVVLALHRALHQRDVLLAVEQRLVHVAGEVAPLGGDAGLGDPLAPASRSGGGTG